MEAIGVDRLLERRCSARGPGLARSHHLV